MEILLLSHFKKSDTTFGYSLMMGSLQIRPLFTDIQIFNISYGLIKHLKKKKKNHFFGDTSFGYSANVMIQWQHVLKRLVCGVHTCIKEFAGVPYPVNRVLLKNKH